MNLRLKNVIIVLMIILLIILTIYIKRTNKENFNTDLKCGWIPVGNTPFDCIKDCVDNKSSYPGCDFDKCYESCQKCDKPENCKWLYKTSTASIKRKQPIVRSDVTECKFSPYGNSIENCINECSQRMDKIDYGGSYCTKTSCANLCYKCDDENWCSWKTSMNFKPPESTILFGSSNQINKINLYWDEKEYVKYYLIISYEKQNPDRTLKIDKLYTDKLQKQLNKIRYTIEDVELNIDYNFYILCVNDYGISLPSNEISIKISSSDYVNDSNNQNIKMRDQTVNKLVRCKNYDQTSISNTALDLFKGKNFNIKIN